MWSLVFLIKPKNPDPSGILILWGVNVGSCFGTIHCLIVAVDTSYERHISVVEAVGSLRRKVALESLHEGFWHTSEVAAESCRASSPPAFCARVPRYSPVFYDNVLNKCVYGLFHRGTRNFHSSRQKLRRSTTRVAKASSNGRSSFVSSNMSARGLQKESRKLPMFQDTQARALSLPEARTSFPNRPGTQISIR